MPKKRHHGNRRQNEANECTSSKTLNIHSPIVDLEGHQPDNKDKDKRKEILENHKDKSVTSNILIKPGVHPSMNLPSGRLFTLKHVDKQDVFEEIKLFTSPPIAIELGLRPGDWCLIECFYDPYDDYLTHRENNNNEDSILENENRNKLERRSVFLCAMIDSYQSKNSADMALIEDIFRKYDYSAKDHPLTETKNTARTSESNHLRHSSVYMTRYIYDLICSDLSHSPNPCVSRSNSRVQTKTKTKTKPFSEIYCIVTRLSRHPDDPGNSRDMRTLANIQLSKSPFYRKVLSCEVICYCDELNRLSDEQSISIDLIRYIQDTVRGRIFTHGQFFGISVGGRLRKCRIFSINSNSESMTRSSTDILTVDDRETSSENITTANIEFDVFCFGVDKTGTINTEFAPSTKYIRSIDDGQHSRNGDLDNIKRSNEETTISLTPTFDPTTRTVGGLFSVVKQLYDTLIIPIVHRDLYKACGVTPARGIILHGHPGTGKSLVCKMFASCALKILGPDNVHVVTVNANKICGEREIAELFEGISQNKKPTLLFIDEVDILCMDRSNHSRKSTDNKIITTMLTTLDGIEKQDSKWLIVVGTTNRVNSIDPAMRRAGRFELEIDIPTPNKEERSDILKVILERDYPSSFIRCITKNEILEISDSTHGFVGADIATLIKESAHSAIREFIASRGNGKQEEEVICNSILNSPDKSDKQLSYDNLLNILHSEEGEEGGNVPSLTIEHIRSCIPNIVPSALKDLHIQIPCTRWSDIGGYHETKQLIKELIIWPLDPNTREVFSKLCITPPRGALLYGPPGCSKTLMAKAAATESKMNFISIRGPEVMSKYVGDSELRIRIIFKKARQSAPCVIFIDEIDSICPIRSSNGGVSDRILAQLLVELDGVEKNNVDIILLAATNRPMDVDPALLRPGRIDRLIHIPLPDVIAIKEICMNYINRVPNTLIEGEEHSSVNRECVYENDIHYPCSENDGNQKDKKEGEKKSKGFIYFVDDLVKYCHEHKYSGAEVVHMWKEACVNCARRWMVEIGGEEEASKRVSEYRVSITWEDVNCGLQQVIPRTDEKTISMYESYARNAKRW